MKHRRGWCERLSRLATALGPLLVVLMPAAMAAQDRGIAVTPRSATSIAQPYAQSWAVVVGVDRFRDRRVASLNYAANDARSVARALATVGFAPDKIFLLIDDQATRVAIERVLSGVIRRGAGPDDRVFVFFAMHGVTEVLPHGGEEGYLLPHDADMDNLPLSALSMQQLKQIGQRIAAKHILIAVDACYGGYSLVRAQAPPTTDQRYLELVLKSRTIQVLTAGRRDQPVIEDQGHGVFTRTLLRGLEGHADGNADGLITATELAAWMHPRVAQASDYKQDMQWGSLDGEGQFVFVLPRQPVASPPAARGPQTPSASAPPVTPPPPAPSGAPAPAGPQPAEPRVAALPPDPVLQPFAGQWEGWMSNRLSEALATLSVAQTGSTATATLQLSSARNLDSGLGGLHESYELQRRSGEPLSLPRTAVAGRWFSGQDAGGRLQVELTLSKDSRTLQGTIKVDGTWYGVSLRRK
ncbi:MAG TPA: caspase family protein [Methylomirabilota bacterium]|nr:caspase family protein [Methylomirabilota bacterium]